MANELDLDPSVRWGFVAFTDGGAIPNPGSAGCGLHGYFYQLDETVPVKPMKFTDGEVIRYAFPSQTGYAYCSKDGALSSDISKKSVPVKPVYFTEISESSSDQHTNNHAEMKSLMNALTLALKHKVSKVHIVSDSNYALNVCMKWADAWAARGWTTQSGEPVKNQALVKALSQTYNEVRAAGIEASAAWIKGHLHPGNMEADYLATIGVIKSSRGIDDTQVHYFTAKEYIEPKRDRHPFMTLSRMYFNRECSRNVPGTYMMGDPGKEDHLIGKPLPEAVFAVVQMNEPIELIESVLQAQYRHGQDFNTVMMMKLETLYTPDNFRLISTHGQHSLKKSNKGTNVVLPNDTPMTIERTPIGITMRAIDSINSLKDILGHYKEVRDAKEGELITNGMDLRIHDLTDTLYEKVEKKVAGQTVIKKVLSKNIEQTQKSLSITVDIGESIQTIPLSLGLDILDRNALKRLETSDPVVHVITWRDSTTSFRYASVLTCSEGIAIWSNYYADRLFLKKEIAPAPAHATNSTP